jgi:hypothetical protein
MVVVALPAQKYMMGSQKFPGIPLQMENER